MNNHDFSLTHETGNFKLEALLHSKLPTKQISETQKCFGFMT